MALPYRRTARTGGLVLLAAVFTVGLAFATVELPYLVDGLLQRVITTPSLDSHADELSRLQTELFIAHYNLRAVGYAAFALLVALIVAGFWTRRTGLAALGALGLMLTVFAQFAAVMFFLAGLGALNVLWLPVLDLPVDLPGMGRIIRAPFDGARWALGTLGAGNTYWPVVLFCIGTGLVVFFLGTLAWLSARTRKEGVATSWIYRISRHPQYLGWILWSYGVYLLLLRGLYPKRSWGIDASLPWLVSTMVIVGVGLVEEMNMRRLHGEAYERYRRSAPFLVPVPAFVERAFMLPQRMIFRRGRFERPREVGVVLGLYTLVLMAASVALYGSELEPSLVALSPFHDRRTAMAGLVEDVRGEEGWRERSALVGRLGMYGTPAVPHLLDLLGDPRGDVRSRSAEELARIPSLQSVPGLLGALDDPDENVRGRAVGALEAIGCPDAIEPLLALLERDEAAWVRHGALRALARLGVADALAHAVVLLEDPDARTRAAGARALGALASDRGLPALARALADESPWVRRTAVISVLLVGSPEGRPLLERVATDDDWEVRLYAAEALKRLPPS